MGYLFPYPGHVENVEQPRCDERIRSLFQTIYEFSEPELKILLFLCRSGGVRVRDISAALGKDRSTVQRALSKLVRSGLVRREPRCCKKPKKGRYFVYSVVESSEVRGVLRERLGEWYQERLSAIESFEWPG